MKTDIDIKVGDYVIPTNYIHKKCKVIGFDIRNNLILDIGSNYTLHISKSKCKR